MPLSTAKTVIVTTIKNSINTSNMSDTLKTSIFTYMSGNFPTLSGYDSNGNPISAQLQKLINSISDGVVKGVVDDMVSCVVDGIIDGIIANATVVVSSVTGVTTGPSISGPGTGTIT